MAYYLELSDDYSIYRSRHTGAIGLWERNPCYGYYAALAYLPEGQKLTLRQLDAWATKVGVPVETARARYAEMVRRGGNGMKSMPDFELPETRP